MTSRYDCLFFVEYFAFDLIVDDEKMSAMHRHVHERKNATEVLSFGAAVQAAILTGEGGLHKYTIWCCSDVTPWSMGLDTAVMP